MLYDIGDYDIRYYDIRVLFGCEVGHPLSTYYATGRMKGGGVIQKVYRCVQRERGITAHVNVRTYNYTFMFLSYGVLSYL